MNARQIIALCIIVSLILVIWGASGSGFIVALVIVSVALSAGFFFGVWWVTERPRYEEVEE